MNKKAKKVFITSLVSLGLFGSLMNYWDSIRINTNQVYNRAHFIYARDNGTRWV